MTEEGRRPNLSPAFVRDLSEKLGLEFVPDGRGDLVGTFGPEDVSHYAYAVFHSPTYRERYAEFLKRDFPRLPLTSDRTLFAALTEKGAELVSLHLLTSPALGTSSLGFQRAVTTPWIRGATMQLTDGDGSTSLQLAIGKAHLLYRMAHHRKLGQRSVT